MDLKDQIFRWASEGWSKAEISLEIFRSDPMAWIKGTHDKTLNKTIEVAEVLAKGWWEKQGRLNLASKTFRDKLWIDNMRNRFPADWGRTETEINVHNNNKLDILTIAKRADAEAVKKARDRLVSEMSS